MTLNRCLPRGCNCFVERDSKLSAKLGAPPTTENLWGFSWEIAKKSPSLRTLALNSVPVMLQWFASAVKQCAPFLRNRDLKFLSEQVKKICSIIMETIFKLCWFDTFRKELSAFTESGILNELYTSFSRDKPNKPTHTRYVQDNIRLQNEKLMSLIFNEDGAVYICGYVHYNLFPFF